MRGLDPRIHQERIHARGWIAGSKPGNDDYRGETTMAEGLTGWRLHLGVIFPTPVPPRAVLEFYEAVPDGVDMTTVSLTIRQLSDDDMDEAIKGMERAAKQLASFDVDLIYQSGVPPVVRRGSGFGDELADRLSQAAGLPAITDMSSVIDAMRTAKLKTLAMAT